jgi:uncharacterized LabA/DUF88 family protein
LARLKRIHGGHEGSERVRRRRRAPQGQEQYDVELKVDALELAEHVDQIMLFSGDSAYRTREGT